MSGVTGKAIGYLSTIIHSIENNAQIDRGIDYLVENKKVRYLVSFVLILVVWQIMSYFVPPLFLPSVPRTAAGMLKLIQDGTLPSFMAITTLRILAGWLIGSLAGVLVGWTLGYSVTLRNLFEPYINFFRGLPPIIWISLVVIWFGYGTIARISLVAYGTFFVVVIDALDSIVDIQEEKVRAARSLGASELETHLYVRIPNSIPEVFTALRVGLGIAAMSIVAVEMLISSSGIGYLVWTARTYLKPEWVFTGIIALGFIAYGLNYTFRIAGRRFLSRYQVR